MYCCNQAATFILVIVWWEMKRGEKLTCGNNKKEKEAEGSDPHV
jgi:hypothetical protein